MWREHHVENMASRRAELDEASSRRSDDLAAKCRQRLIESVQSTASSTDPNRLGILLSGGVDSCAILEAAYEANVKLAAAITVSIIDPDNPDRRAPEDELYAAEAVRLYNEKMSHGMGHKIVRVSPARLIHEYSPPTIKTLALWGYMETRNSLIISAAFHEASKLGLTDIFVGDNADELFGGSYDVYFDKKYINDPEGWKKKRDSMADLPFVTQKLARSYNIITHQPFVDRELFVKWALNATGRSDCIASCKLQTQFGEPYELQNCGKIPLREAFCTIASWRRMDWIFRGSGAEQGNILVDYYNKSAGISDGEFKAEQGHYLEKGIQLQSKEHLHNIRIFQNVFGGLNHPTKKRYPIGDPRGCVSCCFEIGKEQFCHLCDQYPAQHPQKSTK